MSTFGTVTLLSSISNADQKRIIDALAYTQEYKKLHWGRIVHDRSQNSEIINKFLSGCATEAQMEALIALSDWTPRLIEQEKLPFWKGITAFKCVQHLGTTSYLNLRFQVDADTRKDLPVRLSISPHRSLSGEQGMLVSGLVSSSLIERTKAPMTMFTTLLLKQDPGGEYIEDILLGDAIAHSRIWVPSILGKDNDVIPAENALSLGLETVIIG